jgi:hypothetical protein
MWLINVSTLNLEFFMRPPSQYAILSHTWGDDEVLFNEMRDISQARTKMGWAKIELTCNEAKRDGLSYAWVDTCCIDKSSSAELGEAINAMFEWYGKSTRCYAYLIDCTFGNEKQIVQGSGTEL